MPLVELAQSRVIDSQRHFLHSDIHSGIDLQPLVIKRVLSIFSLEVTPHMFGIKGNLLDVQVAPRFDIQRGLFGLTCLGGGDKTSLHHLVEHVYLALLGTFGVAVWRIFLGRLGQPRQKGAFG